MTWIQLRKLGIEEHATGQRTSECFLESIPVTVDNVLVEEPSRGEGCLIKRHISFHELVKDRNYVPSVCKLPVSITLDLLLQ